MPVNIDAVQDSTIFPDKVEVVVVGGGIIGSSIAYELACKGISVALLEKGMIGAEQSSRNWGWVRQQNRALSELPLAMCSLKRWEQLSQEIGKDLGFRRTGILYSTTRESDMAMWEKWGKQAKELGFTSHLLATEQTQSRLPGSSTRWLGGVWSPDDGRAEPSTASPMIAYGARERGAYIHQNCAVRGIDISAGRVSGVWTERGLIGATTVVCAGGAWSSRFCNRHGIALPTANIVGTAMKTTVAPELISGCLSTPKFSLRRRLDGAYTLSIPGRGRMEITPQGIRHATRFYQAYRSQLAKQLKIRIGHSFFSGPDAMGGWDFDQTSPFEQHRIWDPAPDKSMINEALTELCMEFPAFKGIAIEHAWGGLIDTTPDIVPVISPVDTLSGLIISSGFSGHGFGLGPGVGKLVTQMITNEKPFTDITPFRIGRFNDGSLLNKPDMM